MKQLTIRGFDEDLERRLRTLARKENISLNQAALRLLRKGAGLAGHRPAEQGIGDRLDPFFGTWSDEEADEFQEAIEAIEVFEKIDEALWK